MLNFLMYVKQKPLKPKKGAKRKKVDEPEPEEENEFREEPEEELPPPPPPPPEDQQYQYQSQYSEPYGGGRGRGGQSYGQYEPGIPLLKNEKIVGDWEASQFGFFPRKKYYLTLTDKRVIIQSIATGGEVEYQDALLENIRSVGHSTPSILKYIGWLILGLIVGIFFIIIGFYVLFFLIIGILILIIGIGIPVYNIMKRRASIGFYIWGLPGPISIPFRGETRHIMPEIPKMVYAVKEGIELEKKSLSE